MKSPSRYRHNTGNYHSRLDLYNGAPPSPPTPKAPKLTVTRQKLAKPRLTTTKAS